MQKHTALQERKPSLAIGAALDRFDFVDQALDHPIAPRQAASVGHRLCIISEAIHKRDQFCDGAGAYFGLPLLQAHDPFLLPE
jgi:hypothetical protein